MQLYTDTPQRRLLGYRQRTWEVKATEKRRMQLEMTVSTSWVQKLTHPNCLQASAAIRRLALTLSVSSGASASSAGTEVTAAANTQVLCVPRKQQI